MALEERRKYKRFKVKEGTLAIEKGKIDLVGQIVDISRDGLSFYYLDNGMRPGKISHIGLYSSEKGVFCNKLMVNNVSDILLAKQTVSNTGTTRRRGVRFGEISQAQRDDIEKFIVSLEGA